MFGEQGMTGLHAAERILWAAQTPAAVVTYEKSLGYVPAQSFPTTQAQADEFKNKLCTKMVADAKSLLAGWTAANINVAEAYGGLRDLMNEQKEKVTKAGLHEEESRYSQRTMDDLRENLRRHGEDLRRFPAVAHVEVRRRRDRHPHPVGVQRARCAVHELGIRRRRVPRRRPPIGATSLPPRRTWRPRSENCIPQFKRRSTRTRRPRSSPR